MTVQLFSKTSTGLRVRLLAIILILIGPLAIYQMVGFYQLRTTRARITQERAFELAKAGAARFQDTIDDTRTVLNLLSRVPEVTNGSPEKCSHFLRDTAATHRWARSLSLIGEDQKVACSTNPSAIGFDVSERSWFLDAHKNGGFNVSGFLVTQVSGMPSTFASLFFRNGLTQRPQTLLASLDLAWFDRISATFGEKQQALVLLIDSDGVILSRYPMSPIPGNANVSRQFLAEISNPERPMFVGVDPDGGERLFGSVSLPEAHAHVVIGFDRAATLGTIDKFIVIAALVFGCVLLLGGFDDTPSADDLVQLLGGFNDQPTSALVILTTAFGDTVEVDELITLLGGFGDTVEAGELIELLGGFDDSIQTDDLLTLLGGFGDSVNLDELVTTNYGIR